MPGGMSNETLTTIVLSSAGAVISALVTMSFRQRDKTEKLYGEIQGLVSQIVDIKLKAMESRIEAEGKMYQHAHSDLHAMVERLEKIERQLHELATLVARHDGMMSVKRNRRDSE